MNKYEQFLNRWAANSERLHRIGIHPFGYDPGFLCDLDGTHGGIEISESLAEIICTLVKQVYPETKNDADMIKVYKDRTEQERKEAEEYENIPQPICPLNMYFEGDENRCDTSKCNFDKEFHRSCSYKCLE